MTGHIRKRLTKKGNSWQVITEIYDPATGQRKRTCQTVRGTKKQAEALLANKIASYNRGEYIEPSEMTVEQCVGDWLKVYVEPSLAHNTLRGYKVNFDNHTLPYIGKISLQKLTSRQIQDMYTLLAQKGLSPRSIQYVHTTLREALKYAYRQRFITVNPADFVSPPRQIKPKVDVYDTGEVKLLLEKARDTPMEIPFNLAVGLGLRRGELLALKWEDFDHSNKTIYVNRNLQRIKGMFVFDTPKTDAGIRRLSVPEELYLLLMAHKARQAEQRLLLGKAYQNNDLIVCKEDGTPRNPGTFSHDFSKFLEKYGLRHIRLHDLRHTNATLMLQYGVPAKVASARLGHANIKITLDTYTHVLPEMQQDAADKLNKGIFGDLQDRQKA